MVRCFRLVSYFPKTTQIVLFLCASHLVLWSPPGGAVAGDAFRADSGPSCRALEFCPVLAAYCHLEIRRCTDIALASSGQHRLRGLGGDEQIVDIRFPFAAFLWKDKEVTSFKPGRGLYHVHQIALGKHSGYDGVLGAVFRAH